MRLTRLAIATAPGLFVLLWSTGFNTPPAQIKVERLMTLSTSAVAVCCCKDSVRSCVRFCTFGTGAFQKITQPRNARAEKQGFNIKLERSFDPNPGEADVFPQDITRVLLNLNFQRLLRSDQAQRRDQRRRLRAHLSGSDQEPR